MTKEEKAYVRIVGGLILGWMCKTPFFRIPKRVKYKIVGLNQAPIYVIGTCPDGAAVKLTDGGFRREVVWHDC